LGKPQLVTHVASCSMSKVRYGGSKMHEAATQILCIADTQIQTLDTNPCVDSQNSANPNHEPGSSGQAPKSWRKILSQKPVHYHQGL